MKFHYGLDEFCKNVIDDLKNRCVNYCYKVRLEQTVKYAKENGYDLVLAKGAVLSGGTDITAEISKAVK